MLRLCVAASLALVSQAAQETLLSASSLSVTSRLEWSVVFTECVSTSIDSFFTISGASASSAITCTAATGSNQHQNCAVDVQPSVLANDIDVFMAASPGIARSNILTFNQLGPVTGTLTSAQTDEGVEFKYRITSGSDVTLSRSTPKPFSAGVQANANAAFFTQSVSSSHYGPREWTFLVKGVAAGASVQGTLEAASAVNELGRSNSDRETSTFRVPTGRRLLASEVDCEVSEWSSWSECSAQCTKFSASFERIGGKRTRTRSVLSQPVGGRACGALLKEENCNTELCPSLDASRPFSAETGSECSNDCQVDSVWTGVKMNDGRDQDRELAGCYCDKSCEERGDCCQGYYKNSCCSMPEGCKLVPEYASKWVAPICKPSDCNSQKPKTIAGLPSFACWCDAQCTVDGVCCGGTASVC